MKEHASTRTVILWGIAIVVVLAWANGDHTTTTPTSSACRNDWRQCKDNSEMVNNYSGWSRATVDCRFAAEKQAKYGTPVFPWFPFGTFRGGDNYIKDGTAILIEPEAQFQNVFGAMVHSRVE